MTIWFHLWCLFYLRFIDERIGKLQIYEKTFFIICVPNSIETDTNLKISFPFCESEDEDETSHKSNTTETKKN